MQCVKDDVDGGVKEMEDVDLERQTQELLSEVSKVVDVFQQWQRVSAERGDGFNVFSLCGVDHYETMHSKILAEFLSPGGSHGQKAGFLKLFCDQFSNHDSIFKGEFVGEYTDAATVSTEVAGYVSGASIGRFDILIEDASTKSVMIIENKIFAVEQPEQLKRYSAWLNERKEKGWRTTLLFLTPDGRDGELEGDGYVRVSYGRHIVSWLKQCQSLVCDVPHIRETIGQYAKHIETIVKGDRVMSENIVAIMGNGNMAAAQKIYENYKVSCVRLANEMLKSVNDELRCATGKEWKVESALDFNRKASGALFSCVDPQQRTPGQIYVIFAETNLWGCQVALWQDGEKTDFHDKGQLKDWKMADSISDSWRVWKFIESQPNWDGAFFDNVEENDEKRKEVIGEIVDAIQTLYGCL